MSSQNDNSFKLTIDNEETVLEHPILMGARLVVPTEQMAATYFNSTRRDSGILPPVVRYVSPDFLGFILERQPFETLIQYKPTNAYIASDTEEYVLNIPWTAMAIRFTDDKLNNLSLLKMFARPTTIYSEDDELFLLPLTNMWANGDACAKDPINKALKSAPSKDLGSLINLVLNSFWETEFNTDLTVTATTMAPASFVEAAVGDEPAERAAKAYKHWSSLTMGEVLDLDFHSCVWERLDPESLLWDTDANMFVRDVIDLVNNEMAQDCTVTTTETQNIKQPFLDYIQKLTLKAANR